jgi:hypothetical protein
MEDIKIIKDPAEQYYISIPGQSFCTFTISAKGDLFISSDWGYWRCAWRSFGHNFKQFLIDTNFDYILGCLVREQLQAGGKKSVNKRTEEALKAHFTEFQRILKMES